MRRIHLTSFRPSHLALLVLPGFVTACPSDDTSATASATDSDTEDESTSNDDDDPTDDPDTSTSEDPSTSTTSPSTTVDPDSSSSSETSESDSDPSTSTGGSVCGDGVVDQGEECDTDDLDGEDCASQGFLGGELACANDCTFDTDACTQATCGDDMIEGTEECEGDDLNGSDCLMQGFDAGELACDACAFDTDACIMFSCGDNMQQDKELCDGDDLAGEDCVSQGFPGGGTLLCDANCGGFDTAQCLDQACGNGIVEPGEVCDSADVGGATCGDLGFTNGSITCADDCQSTSATGCFTQTSFCATPSSAIGPDANTVTISTVDVGGLAGNVIDVDVSLNAAHTWVADMDTTVTHLPTNTQTFVLQDTCISGENDVNATFDQDAAAAPDCLEPVAVENTVLPSGNLDTFNGVAGSGNGTWELSITDDANIDGGTLNEWCVIISTDAPADQGCSVAFEQDAYDASITFVEATELLDTRMAIAWDGTNLWSGSGGSSDGNRLASHDAAGVVLQYFQPGLDLRSVFTLGDGTGTVYSRAYNDAQIRVQQAPGVFVNDVLLAGGVLDAQSAVVWDEGTSEFIAHIGGTVNSWDAAGNSTGSVVLAGFGVANENQYPQNRGVASACGYYLTYSESTLSAWDAAGNRVDTTVLNGAGASFDSHFSYSYAQGAFFVLDDVGGSWRAYDVL